MLVVPVGVGLQQAAGDEVAGEASPLRTAGSFVGGAQRIGKLQQQSDDLGAGEFSVRQRGGDRLDPSALGPDVDREAIDLGEFAATGGFVAPRPSAPRNARQQRDAADPQPIGVAFDAAGAQLKAARKRQFHHFRSAAVLNFRRT
ncbi:MAG: hypothetical protein ABSC22_06480 [Roseiarcus sp.]